MFAPQNHINLPSLVSQDVHFSTCRKKFLVNIDVFSLQRGEGM